MDPDAMSSPVKSLNVLVVDDEPLIAMSITDMLEDLGHRVVTAVSAREALALLDREADLDLVITDQMMPDMMGTELARQAMSRHADLTVFLSTGYSDLDGETDRGLPRLRKPYTLSDLEALIATQFGLKAQS
jgi:CheY-like chemotaxis protein